MALKQKWDFMPNMSYNEWNAGNTGTGNIEWKWGHTVEEYWDDNYVSTNSSRIVIKAYLSRTRVASYFGGNANVYVKCNGETKGGTKTYTYPTNVGVNQWILMYEDSFTVKHEPDGTKTIDTSSWMRDASFSPRKGDSSGTVTLNTIPRPTAPSISGSINSKSSASRGGSNGSAKLTMVTSSGDYATISSYGCKLNGTAVSGNPATFTGLKNNTTYNWTANITNSAGLTGSDSGSFYLDPVAPSTPSGGGVTFSRSGNNYTATISLSSSYDTNRKFHSYVANYGSTTNYGSTANSNSSSSIGLPGLLPNTTYYYRVYSKDQNNGGPVGGNYSSGYKTGSFKTPCNKPGNLEIVRLNSETTSIAVKVSGSGDLNAPITNYTIWWRKKGGTAHSHDIGTGTTYTITGLEVDTDYELAVVATNAAGSTDSGWVKTFSTTLNYPSISPIEILSLTPFACSIKVQGSITPARTLQYCFSKDGGATWTAYQNNNTYNWTGLTEETRYEMGVKVKASHKGVNATDTTVTVTTFITTPADQAMIYIKSPDTSTWKKGKLFIKVNGVWVKAKKVYTKTNGQWTVGRNK